ncbi:MAG: type II toxin-antitoxin system RelE/ParE family toxin, partial [Ruthenibacterium sp.]
YAVKITKSLQEFSDSLEMMPERFALARNIVLRRQGYRCGVCCDKYLVLYKVNGEKKEVQIFAIVNGTRDYVNLVF